MYTFGETGARKQKHPKEQLTAEYMILGSEPSDQSMSPVAYAPSFSYMNRYLAKRRVMRTIRRLRLERHSGN